jgi:hypothetical protein
MEIRAHFSRKSSPSNFPGPFGDFSIAHGPTAEFPELLHNCIAHLVVIGTTLDIPCRGFGTGDLSTCPVSQYCVRFEGEVARYTEGE